MINAETDLKIFIDEHHSNIRISKVAEFEAYATEPRTPSEPEVSEIPLQLQLLLKGQDLSEKDKSVLISQLSPVSNRSLITVCLNDITGPLEIPCMAALTSLS